MTCTLSIDEPRPFRSLVDIFIGWVNNTQANHQERIEIIESVLLKQYPGISWKLLLALLPGKTTVTSGLNRPIYQDWAIETERTVLIKDYQAYVSSIVDILFREVEKDLDNRLSDLLESLRNFDDKYQKKLIQRLKSVGIDNISPVVKEQVVDTLRKFISQSRKFSDVEWSANEELLIQWEKIIKNFEPDDIVSKNTYLFNDYFPDMLYPRVTKEFDHKQEEKLITQTRILAIDDVFEARCFDGIEKLIEQCSYPSFVGHSLSLSKYSDNFLGKIKEWIEKDDSKLLDAVRMYLSSKKKDDTWDYVDKLLNENSAWPTNVKTNLLLTLPVGERSFAIVEKQNDKVQKEYWHRLYRFSFFSGELNEAQYAAQKFLENDRPFAALAAVSQHLERHDNNKLDVNLIANILKHIIRAPKDIESPLNSSVHHQLLKAIRFIDNSQELSENEIVQIEWALLPIFRYDKFIPNRLSSIVATDPSVFAQLVIWAFRSEIDRKTDRVLDEETRNRAEMAHILLDKLNIIPGSSEGTGINTGVLNQWVNEVRRMLEEADRKKIGDDQIGNYLSNSPNGSDGVWPHETIRDVM